MYLLTYKSIRVSLVHATLPGCPVFPTIEELSAEQDQAKEGGFEFGFKFGANKNQKMVGF